MYNISLIIINLLQQTNKINPAFQQTNYYLNGLDLLGWQNNYNERISMKSHINKIIKTINKKLDNLTLFV